MMPITKEQLATEVTAELNRCFAECENDEERQEFAEDLQQWADSLFYAGAPQS